AVEKPVWEADLGQHGRLIQAAVSQIVDGGEGTATHERRVARHGGAEVDGNESSLPVVAVKDVGTEQVAGDFEGGAGEQREADVVVRVIATGIAIQLWT